MIKPYTVLLLRPDHVADNYGQDTYQTWVKALDPRQAIRLAQNEACHADFADDPDANPDDYHVLACYAGKLTDLSVAMTSNL